MRAAQVTQGSVRIGLFGMAPDTANMGVSALCKSFLAQITRSIPNCEPVIFDNGLGLRRASFRIGTEIVPVLLCGARGGRRYYRPENLYSIEKLSRVGPIGRANSVVRVIDSCAVIMDASAGDSFSDMYGPARFESICLPKDIAARRSRPLLLLPQTYGPFASSDIERRARRAVLGSGEAWARDEDSFQVLKGLLGDAFNPHIHRSGVDMAFALPTQMPKGSAMAALDDWLDGPTPLIGFNVSGLIWHLAENAATHFGFMADYRELVRKAIAWLLKQSDARVLLVPHVIAPSGSPESDTDAAKELLRLIGAQALRTDRVRIAPANLDEQELKWLIGHCHWFCGTRMHATIAALSSGVPSSSIVYSDKAAGVFKQCGQRDHIIDPRRLTTHEALERFTHSFERREQAKASLANALVQVREMLDRQTTLITQFALQHA